MTRRVVIRSQGGPEVLEFEDVSLPAPGPGEVRIRHTAIGVNFIDTYHRSGLYALDLPSGLGLEAVGVIEAVGGGVTGFSAGERVAYVNPPPGAYAEARNYSAERLVSVPPALDDEIVAGALLKGLTVWYLVRRTRRLLGDESILVYAAAGGVGQLLVQWARHIGVTIYGVVGTPEKAAIALAEGCDEVFLSSDDYVAEIRERGGVDVAYDSVGADTFERSLDCLRPLGMMVSYGNASGAPPDISPAELARRGSLFLTRPILMDYIANHDDLVAGAREVFELIGKGVLRPHIGQSWSLSEVADVHRALEARQTRGSTVMRP